MIYLTITAGLEALIITGLIVALMLHSKGCAELVANLDERHAVQTNRLVAAIQRPDIVQPAQAVNRRTAEEIQRDRARARDMASVGTVAHMRPE